MDATRLREQVQGTYLSKSLIMVWRSQLLFEYSLTI
jgi:hypothetical protein